MMEAFRIANVFVRKMFAGTLKETDEGYSFSYDSKYLNSTQTGLLLFLLLIVVIRLKYDAIVF